MTTVTKTIGGGTLTVTPKTEPYNEASNEDAFAVIKSDGSVITWGDASFGGDSSKVAKQLDGTIDVTQIFSTGYAFAALRVDGSVITWGDASLGGDSSKVAKQLDGTIDVTNIFSNDGAFAALRVDGSVITWGDASSGGTKQLDGTIDFIQRFSSVWGSGFTALRADGSVVKWGAQGGDDSIQIPTQLNRGVVSFADPSTDDVYVSASSVNHVPTGSVKVSGTTTQGKTLTVSNNLKDVDGIGAITYEWKTGETILGMGKTYKLSQVDVGNSITVSVNYVDKLGNMESVSTAATKYINNINDLPTGSVVIYGIAAKNNTLTASNTLADEDGLGLITYQWKTGRTVLGIGETYTLQQSDIGKTISVTATYTDGYKKVESVSSKSTSPVINDVTSNSENDIITGTSGRNTLTGGLGNDTLTGGLGSDTFIFNTTLNAQTNVDTITDFVPDVDQIQLAKSIMTNIGNVGNINASTFTLSTQSLTAANRIIYDLSLGALSYDADGSGSIPAIQFAIIGVSTHPILSNTDFVIV